MWWGNRTKKEEVNWRRRGAGTMYDVPWRYSKEIESEREGETAKEIRLQRD
jgi:hypothetical protein